MKIKLHFLIMAVLLIACSSLPPSSRVGNCEGPFVDQKKVDGIYTCYFPSGKLSGKFMYKDGMKNGASEIYSEEDGHLTSTIEYKNNWVDGTTREFDSKGHLKIQRNFKEGKSHGEYTEYWSNGKVKSYTTFENGNEIGPETYFDQNGLGLPLLDKVAP